MPDGGNAVIPRPTLNQCRRGARYFLRNAGTEYFSTTAGSGSVFSSTQPRNCALLVSNCSPHLLQVVRPLSASADGIANPSTSVLIERTGWTRFSASQDGQAKRLNVREYLVIAISLTKVAVAIPKIYRRLTCVRCLHH